VRARPRDAAAMAHLLRGQCDAADVADAGRLGVASMAFRATVRGAGHGALLRLRDVGDVQPVVFATLAAGTCERATAYER